MEPTSQTQNTDTADVRARVEDRIGRFRRPASLPAGVAEVVLPRLRELTRLAGPTSADDARNLLTAGCRLVADTTASTVDGAGVDVDAVFSEVTVAVWSHDPARRAMAAGTLANYLRFLNRLVRAANGLPPRAATRRRRPPGRPLVDEVALLRLAGCLAVSDPAVAVALVAAAGAGVVPTSVPVVFAPGGGVPVVASQGGRAVPVTAAWAGLAGRLVGVVAGPDDWARLRRTGAAVGVTGPALRLRWAVDVVAASATPLDAIRTIPRDLLTSAVRHVPPVEDDAARVALRG